MDPIRHQVKTSGERLDKYLSEMGIATSRSEAARWIEDGFVEISGKVVRKSSQQVHAGEELLVRKPAIKIMDLTPKALDFEVFFEDKDLLVLNKPAGLVVHPGAGNYDLSLVHGLLHRCKDELSGIGGVERPGIVHRLDKGTSGVMVVAKSDFAHQDLSRQFQNHEVVKTYKALVLGEVTKSEQTLIHLMKRSELNRKKFVVNQKKGKQAITHVSVLRRTERVSFVSVRIETGRTHQIRVHLSHIGYPILGDETYGGTKKLARFSEDEKTFVRDLNRPLLHSFSLCFKHPKTKQELTFEAPLSLDFEEALRRFLP